MLSAPTRVLIVLTILGAGFVLAGVTGLPSHAPHWQLFAQAYRDGVTVTRAEYRAGNGELRVRAESRSASSTLRVYDRAGNLLGPLARKSATQHEADLDVAANPMVITVRSDEGGEATVLVSGDNPPTVTPALTVAPSVTAATPSAEPSRSPTVSVTDTVPPPSPSPGVTVTTTPTGPTAEATASPPQSTTPAPVMTTEPRVYLPLLRR